MKQALEKVEQDLNLQLPEYVTRFQRSRKRISKSLYYALQQYTFYVAIVPQDDSNSFGGLDIGMSIVTVSVYDTVFQLALVPRIEKIEIVMHHNRDYSYFIDPY